MGELGLFNQKLGTPKSRPYPTTPFKDTMTSPVEFEAFDIPGARTYFGNVLPYGLQVKGNGSLPTVADAAASLRALGESGKITELLNLHGAVLFRGIGNPSAKTFSDLVSAAEEGRGGYPHEQIGLAGKRSPLAKFIYTANESPPERRFYQHNEVFSAWIIGKGETDQDCSTRGIHDFRRTSISTA